MLIILLSISLTFSTIAKQSFQQPKGMIKINIHKSFKRNKDIWGTYKQTTETIIAHRGGKKFVENTIVQTGDAILSKGNLVIVRSVREKEKDVDTKILVKTFPYKKKKGNFQIDTQKQQNDFLELYGPKITAFLKRKNLHRGKITIARVQEMTCQSKSLQLDCTIPLVFQVN